MPSDITLPFTDDRSTTAAVGVIGFTILLYDHIITFSEEVEYIWLRRKQKLTYLFLVNRYLTPLGFIVNLWAYLWTEWTYECSNFVQYEGAMTVIGINIVELMMLIRIRVLYRDRHQGKWIVGLVSLIFVIELAVNCWLVATGQPAQREGSCSMIFDPRLRHAASSSAWLPLLYDTVILILTLYRTLEIRASRRRQSIIRSPILKVLQHEGLLYYSVICSVTLVLTIMINTTRAGIQNITAQLELLLTVAMMSRITLDLKKHSRTVLGDENCVSPHAPRFGPVLGVASNHSEMVFREIDPQSQSVSVDLPRETNWSQDLEQTEDEVVRPRPVRPRPTRWWSSFTARSRKALPESDRGEGTSASAPQKYHEQWIEFAD